VAVEEPTYNNVLATLFALGIRPVPVPMTHQGPDLDALERTLARPEVKLFYTIPTFHNPMGISTSAAHRRALLQVAARCGKPVVEDAFEMDLWHDGPPAPPLAALDRAGWVVHLFSFSKSLFPGARVGSVLARGRPVEALVALKRSTDLSDAQPLQAALAEFVASGAYDRHLVRLRRVLASRRAALFDALAAHMPTGTAWTEPRGGYQLWVELPEGVDSAALGAEAARAGVLIAPGHQFNVDGRPSNALRLTVAMADEAAIERAVSILGTLAHEHQVRGAPAAPRTASVHV
jgi:DNA-binding transcriptional MocR family regulator